MDNRKTQPRSINESPIKIVYITHGGGSSKGGLPSGSTRVVVNLANMHSSGYTPVVIFMGQDAGGSIEAKQILAMRGVRYYDIEWHGRRNILAIILALLQLYQILRYEHPDVVFLNGVPGTYLGWLPARVVHVKLLIAVVHNLPSDRIEKSLSYFLRFSDHLIYVSPSLYDYYANLISRKQIGHSIIPNGINLCEFDSLAGRRFQKKPYFISMSARLNVPKDPITLVKSLAMLRNANHPVKLRFIGDGPMRAAIETLSSELGIREHVTVTGYTDHVNRLLDDTDIFVLSTLGEGQGLAVVEAMAAGLPVIASRVAGVIDVIRDRQTGLLVPPEDPVSLTTALEVLLKNPKEALQMGQRARAYALEHFDAGRMTQDYETLVSNLLSLHANWN